VIHGCELYGIDVCLHIKFAWDPGFQNSHMTFNVGTLYINTEWMGFDTNVWDLQCTIYNLPCKHTNPFGRFMYAPTVASDGRDCWGSAGIPTDIAGTNLKQ